MNTKLSGEIISRVRDWLGDPAVKPIIGSHGFAARKMVCEIIHGYELLQKAEGANPTVAIFGASQAGKSYLTAKICEENCGNIIIKIDKDYDFLREINPAGGRESTALVTRMTKCNNYESENKPDLVSASLLTVFDLIAVFINIYIYDLKNLKTINRQDVAINIKNVCGEKLYDEMQEPNSWIDPGLVYLSYIINYLPIDLEPYHELLRLPHGALDGRTAGEITELFSPMWGGVEQLSSLFQHLCEYLIKWGHPGVIHLPVDAFVPRSKSIIDVAALANLGVVDQYGDQLIEVMTKNGNTFEAPRPVLCALISEIEFILGSPKATLLNDVDILDFPGARSRIRRDIENYEDGGSSQLFLRGKISHLFEAAAARDEIDTLLLCVKPGPMDVATLPETIRKWVSAVPADQISERLFVLATQFDVHFPDAAGQSKGDVERFDNAIYSAILEPFAPTEQSWLYDCNFTNIYPIRNPNYPYNGFFVYDEAAREVGLRDDSLARMAELGLAFSKSGNVTNHVHKSEEKWASLMTPGDGGALMLIDDLEAIDWSKVRSKRFATGRRALFDDLFCFFEPFAVHDDLAKKLRQEKGRFLSHYTKLQEIVVHRHLAPVVEVFAISPLFLKERVSLALLSDDHKIDSATTAPGVKVPKLLKGEISEDGGAELKTQKGKLYDRIVSSLLFGLLEGVEVNISNYCKGFGEHRSLLEYISGQLTCERQLEKIKLRLYQCENSWTVGLKMTDNLEPLCMIASRVFQDHVFGIFTEKVVRSLDVVVSNPTVNQLNASSLLSANVDFFNLWMENLSDVIEDNVIHGTAAGPNLKLNEDLLSWLGLIEEYVASLEIRKN